MADGWDGWTAQQIEIAQRLDAKQIIVLRQWMRDHPNPAPLVDEAAEAATCGS